MLLAKTDKARTAIQNRDAGLSAQERHILIVSNGERSLNDIVSMLGPATLAPIDRLLREGYLQAVAGERAAEQLAAVASQGMNALLRASRDLATRVQERAQAAIEAAKAAGMTSATQAACGTNQSARRCMSAAAPGTGKAAPAMSRKSFCGSMMSRS